MFEGYGDWTTPVVVYFDGHPVEGFIDVDRDLLRGNYDNVEDMRYGWYVYLKDSPHIPDSRHAESYGYNAEQFTAHGYVYVIAPYSWFRHKDDAFGLSPSLRVTFKR